MKPKQKSRTYVLKKAKPPAKKSKSKAPATITHDNDYLPMCRELGDPFSFQFEGHEIVGTVQRSWGPLTIIAASDGNHYIEDTRKETDNIRQAQDHERCVHCGGFVCDENCPSGNRNEKLKTFMREENTKHISIADLRAMPAGDDENPAWINDVSFEGILGDIKKFGDKGSWKGVLKQASNPATKIAVIFRKVDPRDMDGKLVHFSGAGMIRSDYKNEKFKSITAQVSVGEKTSIAVTGEAVTPITKASTPDNGRDAPTGQQRGNAGILTDVLRRSRCYFGVLLRIEKAYEECKEKGGLVTELSPADLKDVATHISMTYRGDYGCYAEPVFEKDGKAPSGMSQKELDDAPSQEWEADPPHGSRTAPPQSTERKPAAKVGSSWKTHMHVKRKVTLGDMDESDQLKFTRWALTTDAPDDEAGSAFHTNVLLMAAERKWSDPVGCFMASLACSELYGDKFGDEDVLAHLQENDSGIDTIEALADEDAIGILGDFDSALEAIVAIGEKRMKAKGKKKAAVSVPD